MDITLLIESAAILSGVLGLLLFLYFYTPNTKKKQKKYKTETVREAKPDFNTLLEVIKDKKSTTLELNEAVDLVLKYYGKIPKKLGMRAHPEFEKYSELIIRICHHTHVNKDIILKLDKGLHKHNSEYFHELNDSLTKGLNTRGF